MSNVPHEIAAEFPEFKERVHELKVSNAHFSRLFDDYHLVNREVHRVEAAGINVADERYEELKKQRMKLKDEIYAMLQSQ